MLLLIMHFGYCSMLWKMIHCFSKKRDILKPDLQLDDCDKFVVYYKIIFCLGKSIHVLFWWLNYIHEWQCWIPFQRVHLVQTFSVHLVWTFSWNLEDCLAKVFSQRFNSDSLWDDNKVITLRSRINGGVLISRGVGNLCKI